MKTKTFALLPAALALAFLALSARATVYQPGLWFVHDETKADVGAGVAGRSDKVPCPGAFMEYTTSYPTNWTNNGGYHESTSFGMSGTNVYDGTVFTWRHNTGFGYAGEFFVEKGRTYTFGEWHGTFLKILLDGGQILDGGAWYATQNGAYTAAETGWIPFELRAGIGTEAGIAGPLYNDFGTGFNTNGVRISGRGDGTWGLPPWRRILDPGDCSLLRFAVPDADYAALDSVAASGSDLALSVSGGSRRSGGRRTAAICRPRGRIRPILGPSPRGARRPFPTRSSARRTRTLSRSASRTRTTRRAPTRSSRRRRPFRGRRRRSTYSARRSATRT